MSYSCSNENIGKRVAELRKQHHLTQVQLADKIGITSKHLSEIERGITGISIDTQIELSSILNCSLDYLIKGEDYKSIDYIIPDSIVSILKSDNEQKTNLLVRYLELFNEIQNS